MSWPISEAKGRALVVTDSSASITVPVTPTSFVWGTVRNTNPDIQYDAATGVFTFLTNNFFTSVANWTVYGASSKEFYADADTSTDGGSTWVRGVDSLRIQAVVASGATASFAFSGYFPAGLKLRFVAWASTTGVTIQTRTVIGSTAPAARLTVSQIIGDKA